MATRSITRGRSAATRSGAGDEGKESAAAATPPAGLPGESPEAREARERTAGASAVASAVTAAAAEGETLSLSGSGESMLLPGEEKPAKGEKRHPIILGSAFDKGDGTRVPAGTPIGDADLDEDDMDIALRNGIARRATTSEASALEARAESKKPAKTQRWDHGLMNPDGSRGVGGAIADRSGKRAKAKE